MSTNFGPNKEGRAKHLLVGPTGSANGYGPVGVTTRIRIRRRINNYGRGQERHGKLRKKKEKGKAKKEKKWISLNPTQSVVTALVNLLPQGTHRVFFDNLFNSANLLRALRQHGHGATGTARLNRGICRPLRRLKSEDTAGSRLFRFNELVAFPTVDDQVCDAF